MITLSFGLTLVVILTVFLLFRLVGNTGKHKHTRGAWFVSKCPACKTLIPAAATVCPQCTSRLVREPGFIKLMCSK
jgi:rRNA maturation endonuclease Nob1